MNGIKGAEQRAKEQGHASERLGSTSAEELRGQLKEFSNTQASHVLTRHPLYVSTQF